MRTDKLSEMDARKFRTATGILMYMAPDRPDCQQAIRNLTKSLKEPTGVDMVNLVRVARYLKGTKDHGVRLRSGEGDIKSLEVYSDTDWASCKKTRKSTACGVFMVNGNLLSSYSRSLSMICRSSVLRRTLLQADL